MEQTIHSLFTIFLLIIPNIAFAVDLFSFYGNRCEIASGVIASVTDEEATVIQFNGELKTFKIDSVKVIAGYHALENPFDQIAINANSPIYEVSSRSSSKPFLGFASNFYENMTLFLDIEGKVRVIEDEQIISLEKVTLNKNFILKNSEKVNLLPPPSKTDCSRDGDGKNLSPSSIIVDQLRLASFWQSKWEGYRRVEGIRERTLFYGRPMLVDTKSRLGIVYTGEQDKIDKYINQSWDQFPLYFSFGGGTPYGFQSHTTMGNKEAFALPFSGNTGIIRSEFKSHLIHGELIGNLSGIATGTKVFALDYRFMYDDIKLENHSIHSFNHLTLLGVDYGAYSLSYGYYFPVFAMGEGREFRQITPESTSPVIRLRKFNKNSTVESLAFYTNISSDVVQDPSNASSPDKINLTNSFVSYYSPTSLVEKASIENLTFRFNFKWQPVKETLAGFGLILKKTLYKETVALYDTPLTDSFNRQPNSDLTYTPGKNSFLEQKLEFNTHYQIDLGKWVALSAQYMLSHSQYQFNFASETEKKDKTSHKIYGVFQLLL